MIVAVNTLAVQAARRATAKIPIVMIGVPDPIGEGFAVSLSRPGHNITGLSNIVTEVSVKHVELLHAAVPKLGLVALLIDRKSMHDHAVTMQQLVDTAIEGIVVARDGSITKVNRRMAELYGLAPDRIAVAILAVPSGEVIPAGDR